MPQENRKFAEIVQKEAVSSMQATPVKTSLTPAGYED